MATLRWLGPGFDLMTAPRSIDRVFEHLFGYGASSVEDGTPTYALPVDVVETEDAYQLYATVAGVPQDGVEVTFEAGMLSLAVKAVSFEVQGNFIRQERPWGNWRRKLELPKDVDAANIAATFENGVLMVRVPKAAKAKPQRIAIGAAAKAIEGRAKASRPTAVTGSAR
jgi:HSP20 family protein